MSSWILAPVPLHAGLSKMLSTHPSPTLVGWDFSLSPVKQGVNKEQALCSITEADEGYDSQIRKV